MIDCNILYDRLKEEHKKSTYDEMSSKYGIAHSYLHNLLNGKRGMDGLTIKMLNKLFPQATLNLHGDIYNSGTNNGVVGVNNGTVSNDCLSAIENKILSTDDLTAEEKIKVLKVLKK